MKFPSDSVSPALATNFLPAGYSRGFVLFPWKSVGGCFLFCFFEGRGGKRRGLRLTDEEIVLKESLLLWDVRGDARDQELGKASEKARKE